MMEQQCSSKPNRTLGVHLESSLLYYLRRGNERCDWFREREFWSSGNESSYEVSIPNGTAFNVFLNINFSEGKLPLNDYTTFRGCYGSYAADGVCMSFPFGITNNILIKARRAEIIFTRFLCGSNELIKYKTTKGEIYYAGNGIILNSKFEPIIIPCYNMNVAGEVSGIVFSVSSSVFTNQSGLVEKFIAKHLLPWIEHTKFIQPPGLNTRKVPLSLEINSNFKDYITVPKITEGNPTADVNRFLKENKQSLIRQIWKQ